MATTKKLWYTSKTIWISFAQGIGGVLLAFLTEDQTLQSVGWFMNLKSVIDIIIRFDTSSKIQ